MHSNTDIYLPNLPDAPQWTPTDEILAKEAADIISKDGWVKELTRAAGEPSDYRGNGTAFILKMRVKGEHPGKPRVNSNWLGSKKRTRDALIDIGVPLPKTTTTTSGPGVYSSKVDAVKDKLRFGFWAKMRCADLKMLLAILKERHREQFNAYDRAVLMYRAEIQHAHDEELREVKRANEKRRRSVVKMAITYDNCADVYRKLCDKLRKGEHLLMNWDESNKTDHEMQKAWTAKTERIRMRVALQVQALKIYYKKLIKRAERQSWHALGVHQRCDASPGSLS